MLIHQVVEVLRLYNIKVVPFVLNRSRDVTATIFADSTFLKRVRLDHIYSSTHIYVDKQLTEEKLVEKIEEFLGELDEDRPNTQDS